MRMKVGELRRRHSTIEKASPKVKISFRIDAALLAHIDRYASRNGITRTATAERWLADSSYQEAVKRLEMETAAYYASLTAADHREDAALARASRRAARRLEIDDGWPDTSPSPKQTRRLT